MSDKTKRSNPNPGTPFWKSKLLITITVACIAGLVYGGIKYFSNNPYAGIPKRAIDEYRLGVNALEQNDPEKALNALLKAAELDQTFADAQARIGEAYFMAAMRHKSAKNTEMKNAMLEQSMVFVNKALAIDINNGFAHQTLGYHAYEKGNLDEALRELEAAETAGVHSFELHTMLGYLYNEKEETAKCIEQYQQALEFRPADIKTLHNLGELFFGVENYQKAIFFYGELLKYDSKDNSIKANYAASLWKSGDQTKAKELFNQILESPDGNKFKNYNTVAWALIDKDIDIEWGIKMAHAADELKPRNIESADILGWGYFKNKDYANAVKYLNMSMKMSPSAEVQRRLTMAKEKLDESLKK
ncbi:tetratricopeptide repeat protein [bacterium]|nr:tetratricopeptide repeat protein [bacterium]